MDHTDGFARGAAALVVRQGISVLLSVVGLLFIARVVGSSSFGVYVAAQAYVLVVAALAQLGFGLAIIRFPHQPSRGELDTAWWLLLCGGALVAGLAWAVVGLVMPGPELEPARTAVAVMLAVQVLAMPGVVPMALLERQMRFGRIAVTDLAGQVLWLVVGFSLARHDGLVALPAAWCAQQIGLALAWHVLAGHRPGTTWSWPAARALLGFGTGYASAIAAWQLRPLVAPTVVGPELGSAAIGQIGMASRLIEALAMFRHAVWRAGAPLLSRLVEDPAATARAAAVGGCVAAVGTTTLCVAVVAAQAPLLGVLGPEWEPAFRLFPSFAVHAMVAALVVLVPLALHMRGLSVRIAVINLIHVALLAGVAQQAVPAYGLTGWAVAEVVAAWSFVGMIVVCPAPLRRELRLLLPPLLLLPPAAWWMYAPGPGSALVTVLANLGLAAMAWHHWRVLRNHPRGAVT